MVWSLIDGKHIVYLRHHDGFLVDMGDDGMDEKINGMAVDFAMRMKEVTLVSSDTAYMRWSCHNGYKLPYQLCRNLPPQQWWPDYRFFGKPAMRTLRMAGAAHHKKW